MISSIRSMMTQDVYCCAPTDTLAQAAHVMWEKDVGWLPVVCPEGKVVGVITDRDICMAALTRGIRLDDEGVESVMTRKVVCAHQSDEKVDLENVMKISQLRRFPVVDDSGHPLGVITLTDLARGELDLDSGDERSAAGVAFTLAVVAGPRHSTPLAAE